MSEPFSSGDSQSGPPFFHCTTSPRCCNSRAVSAERSLKSDNDARSGGCGLDRWMDCGRDDRLGRGLPAVVSGMSLPTSTAAHHMMMMMIMMIITAEHNTTHDDVVSTSVRLM